VGGAIAINAFGQIDEIDGVIAKSAYSSFEDVVIDQMGKCNMPAFIQAAEKPIIKSALIMIFGYESVEQIKPVDLIKNANARPVLLIACSGDEAVPAINMQRLSESNPEAETWLRDSWEHFIVQDCDFENVAQDKEYCNKVLCFLEKIADED
jgi:hypothetical protein